ncbi:MAG: NAD(P)H-binding protein [Steroidobacteraceae bacterium]
MRTFRTLLAGATCLLLAAGFAPAAFAQTKAEKPLKIVVYGGSGNIGSRIVNEAMNRGHSVTIVDRNPRPIEGPHAGHVKLVQGDALDSKDIAKNIAGQDVIISSVIVRPTPTPDFSLRVVQAMVEGLRTQTGTQKTRLLVVGGASSLYDANGKRLIDSFTGPVSNEAGSAVLALDWLRTVNDVSWTFFSPPRSIQPGTRTGKFRIGTDQLVVDAAGQSAISMEDYAVAMLDEVEKPRFVNSRFTIGY